MSKPDSLFRLHLSINFGNSNPHRRIQESLTSVLNNDYADFSLDSVLDLLSITLPLLQTLDRITANNSLNEPLAVQVTVRNAKTFRISYPAAKRQMQWTAGRHMNQLKWILKDVSNADQDKSSRANITTNLQETLYDSRGDGWKGLGNGAVAEVDGVCNLILELHKCLADAQTNSETTTSGSKGDGALPDAASKAQSIETGQPRPPGNKGENSDIIMID